MTIPDSKIGKLGFKVRIRVRVRMRIRRVGGRACPSWRVGFDCVPSGNIWMFRNYQQRSKIEGLFGLMKLSRLFFNWYSIIFLFLLYLRLKVLFIIIAAILPRLHQSIKVQHSVITSGTFSFSNRYIYFITWITLQNELVLQLSY